MHNAYDRTDKESTRTPWPTSKKNSISIFATGGQVPRVRQNFGRGSPCWRRKAWKAIGCLGGGMSSISGRFLSRSMFTAMVVRTCQVKEPATRPAGGSGQGEAGQGDQQRARPAAQSECAQTQASVPVRGDVLPPHRVQQSGQTVEAEPDRHHQDEQAQRRGQQHEHRDPPRAAVGECCSDRSWTARFGSARGHV